MSANPFTVLSYVGGPALLTNASSLFVLSTSNRFARAIDRARFLSESLGAGEAGKWTQFFEDELVVVSKRLVLIARALTGFYFAAAMFALATLASIAGAVLAEFTSIEPASLVGTAALACGLAGFVGFVTGATSLVAESRKAMSSLMTESKAAIAIAAARREPPLA